MEFFEQIAGIIVLLGAVIVFVLWIWLLIDTIVSRRIEHYYRLEEIEDEIKDTTSHYPVMGAIPKLIPNPKTERRITMYSKRCPECGAYLDPGERCDCWKTEQAPAPITAKRAEVAAEEKSQYKGGSHHEKE